ncbi:MAG: ATP-binding cassette domain-containing protein [Acidobacteria bacterium]|jgi:lipooligosaccharide transport system ATP-binding protein|nr:ATP-binding cassette domain-containing protein [Acidobacteriota bacterium]
MSAIIIADSLRKKYGDFTAVDGISFAIAEGECFGFLGPNGAGKTSTVRMIHCVSPVTSGTLTVQGLPAHVDNRVVKKQTGVIPQEINLDNDLTVWENLRVFAHFFDIPGSAARRRIDELLKFVELEKKRASKIAELSTGMKRRLLIARALLNQPKLIIADEPTTGLDPQARHLIWQRLRQLKSQGATLILTTQYMEEAQQLCDRIVIMHQGRILKAGAPARLIADEIGREVTEIRAAADQDERLLAVLAPLARGHERVGDSLYFYCDDGRPLMKKVLELDLPDTVHRPASLEDVFLKLTGRSLIE